MPRELFDRCLALHGALLALVHFIICECDRAARFGIFGAGAGVVGGQAFLQIVCPAAIERIVGAAQDVGLVHGHSPLALLYTFPAESAREATKYAADLCGLRQGATFTV